MLIIDRDWPNKKEQALWTKAYMLDIVIFATSGKFKLIDNKLGEETFKGNFTGNLFS